MERGEEERIERTGGRRERGGREEGLYSPLMQQQQL